MDTGAIQSVSDRRAVRVEEVAPGAFGVSLLEGTFKEQSAFADAVDEVLAPIQNPRYLITRRDGGRSSKQDVHAVPQYLAANNDRAARLIERWQRRLGPAELVYARTPEGRKLLLKARTQAFSSSFAAASERRDVWQ